MLCSGEKVYDINTTRKKDVVGVRKRERAEKDAKENRLRRQQEEGCRTAIIVF
jgi:hypothetical protein